MGLQVQGVIARRLDTVGVMPTMPWIFLLAAYHWQDGYHTLNTVHLLLLRCIACQSFSLMELACAISDMIPSSFVFLCFR